ncbi:MAG: hypothetical protein L6R35_005206 [Caloplaca aegaea]|nr:MAG: hypothetical protein L6R35_005206 [Caloplaca aegaea]
MAHEAPNHSPVPDGVPDGASAYDQRVVASRPALDVVSPQYTEAANAAAGNGNGGSGLSPQDGQQTPASGKSTRHRNKPSLSCSTCTSKKTKCDRSRPKSEHVPRDFAGTALLMLPADALHASSEDPNAIIRSLPT